VAVQCRTRGRPLDPASTVPRNRRIEVRATAEIAYLIDRLSPLPAPISPRFRINCISAWLAHKVLPDRDGFAHPERSTPGKHANQRPSPFAEGLRELDGSPHRFRSGAPGYKSPRRWPPPIASTFECRPRANDLGCEACPQAHPLAGTAGCSWSTERAALKWVPIYACAWPSINSGAGSAVGFKRAGRPLSPPVALLARLGLTFTTPEVASVPLCCRL